MTAPASDRRQVDWGGLISKLPLILTLGGIVLAVAQVYFQMQYVTSKVNPEAVAKWEREAAETRLKAEQTQDINNRRWCYWKAIIAGSDENKKMECFD